MMLKVDLVQHFPVGDGVVVTGVVSLAQLVGEAALRVPANQPRIVVGALLADYYARLIGWYTQGGFTDELGKRYDSGHHYSVAYWEVLNEVDFEHHISPETYTLLY